MSDPALKKCEFCKGRVERLIGAGGGLNFKGSGFYETDYKRRKTADGRQKTEDGGQKTEDGGRKTENGKQKTEGKKEASEKKSEKKKE